MEAVSFKFGDSRELCDRLTALVRTGAKTATCGALRDFDAGEEMPVVGRRDTVLDWDGNPVLRIETTEVTIRRFRDVLALSLRASLNAPIEPTRFGIFRM